MNARAALAAVFTAASLLVVSCDDTDEPQVTKAPEPAASFSDGWVAASDAAITASPNPVPVQAGLGTTTIRWESGSQPTTAVFVSVSGGSEVLFGEGARGESAAKWIQPDKTYEFRMYSDKARSNALARVTVTAEK